MTASVVAQEEFLDYLFSTLYSTYAILGFILNSIVLWLIIKKKHNSIKQYRILLGNSTCTLILLSMLTFFLQLRFVIEEDSLGYIALGPARLLNKPRLVLFCTALFLAVDFYAFMTIAMCMVYKFATINGKSPTEKRLVIASALFFLLPLSTAVALFICDPNFEELYAIFDRLKPEYELRRYGNYSGLPNVKNIYVMYLIIVLSGISVTSFGVMMTVGFRIRSFIKEQAKNMSANNTQMFSMMAKALTIQYLTVIFSFPGIILYVMLQFTSFRSVTAEYLAIAISPMAIVIDPCITLYYVLPYRRYLLGRIGLVKESILKTTGRKQQPWCTSKDSQRVEQG